MKCRELGLYLLRFFSVVTLSAFFMIFTTNGSWASVTYFTNSCGPATQLKRSVNVDDNKFLWSSDTVRSFYANNKKNTSVKGGNFFECSYFGSQAGNIGCAPDSLVVLGPGHVFNGTDVGSVKIYRCSSVAVRGDRWSEYQVDWLPDCAGATLDKSSSNAEKAIRYGTGNVIKLSDIGDGSYIAVEKKDDLCVTYVCKDGFVEKNRSCVKKEEPKKEEPKKKVQVVGTQCSEEDLPVYAKNGVYVDIGGKVVCAATACKSGTYLVVNSAGQSQGWCVAPSHCKDDSTHLNIIGETKTDLQCLPNDGGSTTPGNVMKISGKVWAASIDAKTNQVKEEYEIPGANIFVAETGALLLVSDTTGSFSSDKFPVGNKLKVSFIGCKDQIVSPGENLTIKLICSDNYLDDVVIESAAVGDPCVGENLMAKSVYATSGIYKRNEKGGITCTVTACSSGYEVDEVNNTCVKSTKDEKINELKNKIDLYAGNIRDIEMAHSGEKASVWKNAEGNFNTSRLLSDSIAGVALGTVGGLVVNKLVKNNHLDTGFEEIGCSIDGNRLVNFEDEFVISGAVDKDGCIGNNFGSSNVYVWASTYSDGSDYSRMVEDTNNQSNNTCWVRVDMDSDNSKIRVSDIPSRWFRVGQQVTCGSWADKSVLQKRVLDARKSARTWATVGGAVGGAGLGVGVMELFGNKLIGGAVEGQKALDEAELLYSQMSDAERQEYADANKQLKKLCSELHANGGTHSACGD